MTKVLVTGASGFTGRYLTRELLEHGYDVCGLVADFDEGASFSSHACDLLDRKRLVDILSVERPDAVVHLAAISSPVHEDVDRIYQANILGTRSLLAALVESRSRPYAVLLASSASVYGHPRKVIVDEREPALPVNDYGVTKLAMEHLARLWQGRLPISIVRPFNYTGVGQGTGFVVPKIVDCFRRRSQSIELGAVNVVRDFSDVRTIVDVYRKLLESQCAGETFNLCSGVGYSLQQIIQSLERISGHSIEVRTNPKLFRANDLPVLIGDRGKIKRVLGALRDIEFEETLAWMLEG
ncbi:NAD-dependent epimerase/dehydratase family protein [Burkholderia cepacia]|uniref:GDP-mannose 4,6-dehydratase n=1 Tax=Burkholderia cepacia TaxID=292 RepID=UPI000F602EFB|nr:GDP-mannose 4,6-dehydratase [Burkholderia cepacia]RQZ59163.1 NAD-dependent epimerase/dehydratase family protein [Burkholderia cepacia]